LVQPDLGKELAVKLQANVRMFVIGCVVGVPHDACVLAMMLFLELVQCRHRGTRGNEPQAHQQGKDRGMALHEGRKWYRIGDIRVHVGKRLAYETTTV
jgi:hypothetical protein